MKKYIVIAVTPEPNLPPSALCEHCEETMTFLKKKNIPFDVIDQNSEYLGDYIEKFNINKVPTIIVNNQKACLLAGDEDKPYLDCNGTKEDLI